MESHQFCNINQDFYQNFFTKFEKITLFCISICIMKLINQKTQNNFFSAQIIVPGAPNRPPGPNRGDWPTDPNFFLGSLGGPNRHNFTN